METKITFDIRSLVASPGPNGEYGKVNFDTADLAVYKEKFLNAVRGTEQVTLTGAGPAWLYMSLWHEAHGTVPVEAEPAAAPAVATASFSYEGKRWFKCSVCGGTSRISTAEDGDYQAGHGVSIACTCGRSGMVQKATAASAPAKAEGDMAAKLAQLKGKFGK